MRPWKYAAEWKQKKWLTTWLLFLFIWNNATYNFLFIWQLQNQIINDKVSSTSKQISKKEVVIWGSMEGVVAPQTPPLRGHTTAQDNSLNYKTE